MHGLKNLIQHSDQRTQLVQSRNQLFAIIKDIRQIAGSFVTVLIAWPSHSKVEASGREHHSVQNELPFLEHRHTLQCLPQ